MPNQTTPPEDRMEREELRHMVHMEMLSKSSNAKKLGELTVIPIGFAVSIAVDLILQTTTSQTQKDTISRMKELSSMQMQSYGDTIGKTGPEVQAIPHRNSLRVEIVKELENL